MSKPRFFRGRAEAEEINFDFHSSLAGSKLSPSKSFI